VADVVVISTSPAIDRIALAAGPVREGVVTTAEFLETPGGKGTHVAMVAGALGVDVALVAPVGGASGRFYAQALAEEPLTTELLTVGADTRGTYTLVDPERADLFEIHEPAADLAVTEVDALVGLAAMAFVGSRVAVIAGGLPHGASAELHARLVRAARDAAAISVVDTSSADALAAALHAGASVAVPNLADDAPDADLVRLARELLRQGGDAIVLTAGARGSFVACASGDAWHVNAPAVGRPRNAVGCGDAFVGGLACRLAAGRSVRDAVVLGAAAAADNLTRLHSGRVDASAVGKLVDQVEVRAL
jgi:fructose-1-phosphate kinase PfkB-like protein